ncbi:hypothetical protein [Pseudarthrobacter sp. MEB009]|uniref:hypothetical protein n=1 Tax=Pseudarthrobacter sp. MEB009 TaxID=3040326 RepID=UPI0025573514|nr:hypothetical protein [Pseudarthrobacter sp. MEB009]
MSIRTVRFPVAKHQARRKGPCPVCGKTVNRTRVFESTQNPFNKDADGNPLDFMSVMLQARLKAELWEPDFTHSKCAEASL